MDGAFEYVTILQKLPLDIECIATSGDILLIGTTKGHLLVYSIKENDKLLQGDKKFKVDLQRSDKKIAHKQITQLAIVEQYKIFITLSEGVISINDSETYKAYGPENQVKGSKTIIYFALDIPKKGSGKLLRMCTVSKRGRLQFYYWDKGEFRTLYPEQCLPEAPRTVVWAGDQICVVIRKEYSMMSAETGKLKSLFDTGVKKTEPVIFPMPNGELALSRDELTVFVSEREHKIHQKNTVTWSDVPVAIQFSHPYMIAALPKSIEISSRNPAKVVQRIHDISGVRSLAIVPHSLDESHGRLHCYAASSTHIWRLVPTPINKQIEQLINAKEFEVALALTNSIEDNEIKKKKIFQIKKLHAFNLFVTKNFEPSFQIFKESETEPTFVIGLYPDLLPEEYRMQLKYPSQPPKLTEGDLDKAFPLLIRYLTEIRTNNLPNVPVQDNQMIVDTIVPESRKRLLQIVETSLLKSYLVTNDKMIAPLLRNSDNNCHLEECERALIKAKKVNELVLLYQSKGIHKKALDLLVRQTALSSGTLRGPEKTIQYLQKLGPEHIQLIFDYSEGVLKSDPKNGLKIFTSETQGIEALPRDKVLAYIENNAKHLVIQYLEHIIYDWKENRAEFHDKLIISYKNEIELLLREHLQSLPESEPRRSAGEEDGELGHLRAKLLKFLESSNNYSALKLLCHFPQDILFEERALLLGRGNRHEEALAIYIYILKDSEMAEDYCRKQYGSSKEKNRNVYISLLKLYLKPQDLPFLGLRNTLFSDFEMEPNIDAALKVLNEHYEKVDVSHTLELLPMITEVKKITPFLMNVFQDKMQQKRNSLVLKSLLHAEHLQVHEQRIFFQSKKCSMTDERACRVCHKRIGTSAFAMYPNGVVVHYYCCKDRRECPPET